MTLWLNGALLGADIARIDPADRGLLLGDGVFETIRVADGEPVWLERHLARLRQGAAVLGISGVPDDDTLHRAMLAVLAARGLRDATSRVTLTRGPAPRGVLPGTSGRPTILITAQPPPEPVPPARLIIATRTRRNEHSPLSRIKSLNYLDSIIARQEAAERGADDAILLNTQGLAAEATASTLLVQTRSGLITPPVSAGALPGVARAVLLDAGAVTEQDVTRDMLRAAGGIILVNALGHRVAVSLEGRPLDTQAPEWTARLIPLCSH